MAIQEQIDEEYRKQMLGIKTVDNVNHPQHYQANGIETIDVIEAWTDGLDGILAVCTANVIKYISRWNKKNGIEDLEKAKWYLDRLIYVLKNRE